MTIPLKKMAKLSLLTLALLGFTQTTYSIKLPDIYEAVIVKMTDNELVNRFNSLLRHETSTEQNNSKIRFFEDSSLLQLPIYRIATLKVIVKEIKKRQVATGKRLLTDSQIMQATNLITSKEAAMQKGIKAEKEGRK